MYYNIVNVFYQGKFLKRMLFKDVFIEFKIGKVMDATVFGENVYLRKVAKP